MKRNLLILAIAMLVPMLFSCTKDITTTQAVKPGIDINGTVNVATPGTLSTLLSTQKDSITTLTLTGTIDARDFVILRDSIPYLSTLNLNNVTIAAYNGRGGTCEDTISYPANVIPDYAFFNTNTFRGKAALSTITLPVLTTAIGGSAFQNCSNLKNITMSNSIASIGDYSFYGCYALTNFTIPNSVTSIGNYAFEYCTGLTNITIANTITSIGTDAFAGCTGLNVSKTVNVSAGGLLSSLTSPELRTVTNLTVTGTIDASDVKCLRDSMPNLSVLDLSAVNVAAYNGNRGTCPDTFYPANEMPEHSFSIFSNNVTTNQTLTSIKLPNSVTSIGINAFMYCIGLTNVTIPNSVISIQEDAFAFCTSLKNVTIPNSVTSIGQSAFYGCTGLTNATIANSVASIGIDAFYNCSSLTSIKIPSSVTSIAQNVFYGCSGLTSVTIPSSVTSIKDDAFYGCTALTTIYSLSTTPPTLGSYCFGIDTAITSVFVPASAVATYQAAAGWSGFTFYPNTQQ
jgi:hypothetical protein